MTRVEWSSVLCGELALRARRRCWPCARLERSFGLAPRAVPGVVSPPGLYSHASVGSLCPFVSLRAGMGLAGLLGIRPALHLTCKGCLLNLINTLAKGASKLMCILLVHRKSYRLRDPAGPTTYFSSLRF